MTRDLQASPFYYILILSIKLLFPRAHFCFLILPSSLKFPFFLLTLPNSIPCLWLLPLPPLLPSPPLFILSSFSPSFLYFSSSPFPLQHPVHDTLLLHVLLSMRTWLMEFACYSYTLFHFSSLLHSFPSKLLLSVFFVVCFVSIWCPFIFISQAQQSWSEAVYHE